MSDAGSPTGPWRLDEARAAAVRAIERLGREDDAIRLSVAGSVRRMAPLHEQVELVASAYDADRLRTAFRRNRPADEIPVRLEVVDEGRFAAAMIRRTGPASHVEALRKAGLELDRAEGWDEASLYESVGLAFVPPERREAPTLDVDPELVSMADVQGVVGLTAASDELAEDRIAQEGYRWADFGTRLRIAEVRDATTARVLRALEQPAVDALAFPFDARLGEREESDVDMARILDACAARGLAVAWSGDPRRLTLDLAWHDAARARGLVGLPLADATVPDGLDQAIYAVGQARRGGWQRDEILTTLDLDGLTRWIEARRER